MKGFIQNLDKADLARNLKSQAASISGSINMVSNGIKSLESQLLAMKGNTDDFSEDDCKDLQLLIEPLKIQVQDLISEQKGK